MKASEFTSTDKVTEYQDPELARVMDKAGVRYPYYKKNPEVFMKWASRAIKHSEEQDEQHNAEITDVHNELDQLKDLVVKVAKSR